MAFFTDKEDRLRLLILYILKRGGIPLSREQLVLLLAEKGMPNYFDVSDRIVELEEERYIAVVPAFGLQLIMLTPKGEEFAALFEKEIPTSIREAADSTIEAHIDEFHRDNTSRASVTPLPDGSFEVSFALLERENAVFEMRFMLPNAKYAQNAAKNWTRDASEIYLNTLLRLTGDSRK